MDDPYAFPFPTRKDLMSLGKIQNNRRTFFREKDPLSVQDIEGARPRPLIGRFLNKQSFLLSTWVEPNPTRQWHKQPRDPLSTKGIEGCAPKGDWFRTDRVTNPLEPAYKLPSFPEKLAKEPRPFLRDTLNIQDIQTKKRAKAIRQPQSQSLLNTGIAKARLALIADARRNKIDVRDINAGNPVPSRVTDLLEPQYRWQDEMDKATNPRYGDKSAFHGRLKHPEVVNRVNDLNLNIKDIPGAQADSLYTRTHFIEKRREMRNSLRTDDIAEAKADTKRRSISTTRCTNPLNPRYQLPGSTAERFGRFLA